jgi:hypothetical protein
MKILSLSHSTCLARSRCSLGEGRPPPGCSRGAESCTCAQRPHQLIGRVLNHASRRTDRSGFYVHLKQRGTSLDEALWICPIIKYFRFLHVVSEKQIQKAFCFYCLAQDKVNK